MRKIYQALADYLPYQKEKYIMPEKAGDLKVSMLDFKQKGQAARGAFTQIVRAFHLKYPQFRALRTSNWANQAQLGRPYFWVYLQGIGEISEPMYAFRLYGNQRDFGLSVEVSFIERKKDETSLIKQNKILSVPAKDTTYYQYVVDDVTYRLAGTEDSRLWLQAEVDAGHIRKVLIKQDLPLSEEQSLDEVVEALYQIMLHLAPFYEATRG